MAARQQRAAKRPRVVHTRFNDRKGGYTDFVVKFRVVVHTSPWSKEEIRAFEGWAVRTTHKLEHHMRRPSGDVPESHFNIVFDYSTSLPGDDPEEWKFEDDDDPAVFMLVHYEDEFAGPVSDKTGMVIVNEFHAPTTFTSSGLAYQFKNAEGAPRWITDVGVSGVTPAFMMQQWWKCVAWEKGDDCEEDSGNNRWGFNRGYMVHDMYQFLSGGWNIVRETSYNFRAWTAYLLTRARTPCCCGWQ